MATTNPRATGTPVARRPAPCCEPVSRTPLGAIDTSRHAGRIALVGNPNVGKSTLFNALTGARQHVGNWPGKTVHVASGTWQAGGGSFELVDLPGTYSLLAHSPDEELTRDLLVDRGLHGRPDLVVMVVDAANLARNLYLLAQVLETGVPVVVALAMVDVAAGRGIRIDTRALTAAIGAPVVTVAPRRRLGGDELAATVSRLVGDGCHERSPAPAVAGTGPVGKAVDQLTALITTHPHIADRLAPRWLATELLSDGPGAAMLDGLPGGQKIRATVPQLRRQLLAETATTDVAMPEAPGGAGGGPGDEEFAGEEPDVEILVAEQRYAWVHEVVEAAVNRSAQTGRTWSDRIDRVLTSRWLGPISFLLVMWGVFVATTRVAAPLQDGLQSLLDGPVRSGVAMLLAHLGAGPGGWLSGLVLGGFVSGVGQLLTFIPLMVIMFVLLAVLEDSGYMARAAFVVDRLMGMIGLPGRAFLPLIVGFGCNVPAIAGTRILADRRQRLLTGLLVPYVTCSARLTVYLLLANVFFGSSAGTVVFAMYLLSIALIVLIGLGLRRTLFRGHRREPLVLELPPYRRPTLRVISTQTGQRLTGFLKTAGGIIVLAVTAVWVLSSIPVSGAGSPGHTPVQNSLFAATARTAAPVFAPAGYGDWHATAALVSGFVAKEAVVSTFGQTYSDAATGKVHHAGTLGDQLTATFARTSGGHVKVAVLAFMVFLLSYTPCVATIAAQRHEMGTRWMLAGMGLQLVIAWLLSVAVFQIGSLLW